MKCICETKNLLDNFTLFSGSNDSLGCTRFPWIKVTLLTASIALTFGTLIWFLWWMRGGKRLKGVRKDEHELAMLGGEQLLMFFFAHCENCGELLKHALFACSGRTGKVFSEPKQVMFLEGTT